MHSTGISSLSHDLTSSLHDGSLETRSHCSGDDHCHNLELEVERTQLTSTCDGGDWKQTSPPTLIRLLNNVTFLAIIPLAVQILQQQIFR